MADSDREFKVRITGDASSLVQSSRESADALDSVSSATKKGTEANASAGKSFIELAEHSRGFHKLLHAITEISPAAGLGLIAAFSGPQAAIMGLIMLVRALKSGEEEAAKAAVEFALEAGKAWGDIEGIIDRVVDGVRKSDQAHADWAKHLGEDSKKITTALDAQIGKLKAEAAAVKEVISATHDAAQARLEADRDAGRVTPEQYAARKANIDANKRMGEESVGATVGQAELAMLQTAKANADKEAAAARKAEAVAHTAAEDLHERVNAGALKAQSEADAKAAGGLKDKLLAAEAGTSEANLPLGFRGGLWNTIGTIGSLGMNPHMGYDMRAQALAKAQEEEDKAAKSYSEREALSKKESAAAARAEAAQNKLDLEAAEAKKKAEAAVAQANELKIKTEALATSVGEAEKGRAQAEPMKRLGEVMPTPFGHAAAEDVRWGAEIASKHGEPSGADRTRLMDLGTRLAGHRVSLAEAVALLAPAARDVEEYSKDVTRLVTIMHNLARNLGPTHGRMDRLEEEVRNLQHNAATRNLPGSG
jgi:hypothetical protein